MKLINNNQLAELVYKYIIQGAQRRPVWLSIKLDLTLVQYHNSRPPSDKQIGYWVVTVVALQD